MSFQLTDRLSLGTWARITGGLFVLYMAVSVLADALGHIGLGDPDQVHEAVSTSPSAFRIGLLAAFVSAFLFLATAWGLYVLLQTVNPELALLFLILNAVGVAVQCASLIPLVAAVHLAEPDAMESFTTAQVQALTLVVINVYKTAFVATQLFFGLWLFPLGYLVYRSGFLPRVLGVLLLLDGAAELVWLVQGLLLANHPGIRLPGTLVSLVAEVGLALWLLTRGVGRRS